VVDALATSVTDSHMGNTVIEMSSPELRVTSLSHEVSVNTCPPNDNYIFKLLKGWE